MISSKFLASSVVCLSGPLRNDTDCGRRLLPARYTHLPSRSLIHIIFRAIDVITGHHNLVRIVFYGPPSPYHPLVNRRLFIRLRHFLALAHNTFLLDSLKRPKALVSLNHMTGALDITDSFITWVLSYLIQHFQVAQHVPATDRIIKSTVLGPMLFL